MNGSTRSRIIFTVLSLLLAGSFLFSACTGAATPALPQPTTTQAPPQPTITSAPVATSAPTAEAMATAAPTTVGSTPHYTLDSTGVATGIQEETVPAVSASANGPIWEVLPEYTRLTLEGYPIANHVRKPQIFIYPVDALGAVNPDAGQIVSSLKTLIQSPQEIPSMPFLPLSNAHQVMHANIQYLDFKNGQGLRYLTQFDQGPIPINNSELFYTYQGLTSDGKYYVAAVLPVNHPSLPADPTVTGNEPPEFSSDFPAYAANAAQALNTQAANTFTPDLTQLDAMMSSLEIQ